MLSVLCRIKKSIWMPIHPKGWPVIGGLAVLTILLGLLSSVLGVAFLFLTLFGLYVFRNPARQVPEGHGFVLAPTDGVIKDISEAPLPEDVSSQDPAEEAEPETYTKIVISVDAVHVQATRVPAKGEVLREYYKPGAWGVVASDKKSLSGVERSIILLKTENGQKIAVSQLADLVPNRVVCQLYEGDMVESGEVYGTLRCGGWCELYLPKGYDVPLTIGSTVVAGETMIAVDFASLKNDELVWKQR